ncbi:MAG: Gfo/Idh/MocA family oxidoreductase [Anaerolineae bacterium]|nr:Gfo/Idh/MocA family oxidoreductase [Anaerolineae bacterium]
MDKVRWGILSTANIGRQRVIPAIQGSHNGIVEAIASRGIERAQKAAAEMSIPRAYGSYEELLADPDIDAIYNPLPNHMHATWSIKAAEAGKATLCEKPFASDATEAQQMVDVFKKRNILLAEAFMYRFHPRTRRVKQLVDEGVVGKIQIIQASFSFLMTPERRASDIRLKKEMAGGALMDVGCYCVNVIRLMTGEEPERATASAKWADSGVDMNLAGTLEFPSGALAHFGCGFDAVFNSSYEIRGDEGRILVETGFVAPPDGEQVIHIWQGDVHEKITIPGADHYQLMVEDFADALLDGRPPRYDPQDGVKNMRVLDRLYASARV